MVVAAYLVGGFLIASVYAVGMLKGRRDRYHRLGFIIPFTVAAIATPIQMAVGDTLARWVYNNEPTKFAAIELVPEDRAATCPRRCSGHLNSDGTVTGGIKIPGLASWLSDPSDGKSTVVEGLDVVPADERPTIREVNIVHLAWDVMVGFGTLLFLLSVWYAVSWIFRRDMPKLEGVPAGSHRWRGRRRRPRARSGLGGHRGRPPAVDRAQLHEGRGRRDGNDGVWITFLVVVVVYVALGATLILRAARHEPALPRASASSTTSDVPYGPRPIAANAAREVPVA